MLLPELKKWHLIACRVASTVTITDGRRSKFYGIFTAFLAAPFLPWSDLLTHWANFAVFVSLPSSSHCCISPALFSDSRAGQWSWPQGTTSQAPGEGNWLLLTEYLLRETQPLFFEFSIFIYLWGDGWFLLLGFQFIKTSSRKGYLWFHSLHVLRNVSRRSKLMLWCYVSAAIKERIFSYFSAWKYGLI